MDENNTKEHEILAWDTVLGDARVTEDAGCTD